MIEDRAYVTSLDFYDKPGPNRKEIEEQTAIDNATNADPANRPASSRPGKKSAASGSKDASPPDTPDAKQAKLT